MEDIIDRLRERAERDDPEACYELGMAYYFGVDVCKDYEQSFYYLKKAYDLGYMCAFSLSMVYAELHPEQ